MSASKRHNFSILLGNVLDHYDGALYGFLAPVMAPLFFPHAVPSVQLIMAYGILASSFLTRPLGTFLFGKLALKYDPLIALKIALIGVSLTTIAMGSLPTYEAIGVVAPILLLVIRIIHGLFAAGENVIAQLYLLENKPFKKASLYAYLYQCSTMLGLIFSSFSIVLVMRSDHPSFCWRIPFWLGATAAVWALFLRRDLVGQLPQQPPVSEFRLIWKNRYTLFRIAIVAAVSYITYYIPFVFLNGFVPLVTSISLSEMMEFNTFLLFFDLLALPVLAILFHRFSPLSVMSTAALLMGVLSPLLMQGLPGATWAYVSLVRVAIVVLGLVYLGPLNLWMYNQLKGKEKYLLVGMGTALGSETLGRTSPAICLFLWQISGNALWPGLYISAVALAAFLLLKR